MSKSQEAIREIVRWGCVLACWHLAHDSFIVLALAFIASTRLVAREQPYTPSAVPRDAVRITVAGDVKRVKS